MDNAPKVNKSYQDVMPLIPGVVLLFQPGILSPWDAYSPVFAIVYWAALYLLFVDRYILMLHCTSHRPCFYKQHRWLDRWRRGAVAALSSRRRWGRPAPEPRRRRSHPSHADRWRHVSQGCAEVRHRPLASLLPDRR